MLKNLLLFYDLNITSLDFSYNINFSYNLI